MSRNQRRYVRHKHRMAIKIHRGHEVIRCETLDISLAGIGVLLPRQLSLRELLSIEIDAGLSLLAMPVQQRQTDTGYIVGFQFYGNGGDLLKRWEAFVRHVSGGRQQVDAKAEAEFAQRRHRPVLHVFVPTVRALEKIVRRDLRRKRTYVASEIEVPNGTEVRVELTHPETHCKHMLAGRVARRIDIEGRGVLAIDILDPGEALFGSIEAFLEGAVEVNITTELEIVDPLAA